MEKLNFPSVKTTSDADETVIDIDDVIIPDDTSKDEELAEKPEPTKKIESFDVRNLTAENIEYMNHVIQDVFYKNFPVSEKLINEISERMKIIDNEEFLRFLKEEKDDADMDLGFYSKKYNQMLVNLSKHDTIGGLFLTMFHEALHFVSIQSGAGLTGDFCYPDIGEDETDELMSELDSGVRAMVEGTTQNFAQAYVMGYMRFDPQPQMFGYEPESQVVGAVLESFSPEEKMRIYFETPLELIRVHVEDVFAKDYDPDKPTGLFADCLVEVARATKRMEKALESWREDNNPDPVEDILNDIRRAVDFYIVRETEVEEA